MPQRFERGPETDLPAGRQRPEAQDTQSKAATDLRATLRRSSYEEGAALLSPGRGDPGAGQDIPDAGGATERVAIDPIGTVDPLANLVEDSKGAAVTPTGNGPGPTVPGPQAAGKSAPGGAAPELTLTQRGSTPNNLSLGSGFGGMSPSFKFQDIVASHAPGGPWKISAALLVECAWVVRNRSDRVDIAGTDSPALTYATWRSASDDLDPELGPAPDGKPTREKYWSRFHSAEHEWFHAADTQAWVASTGLALVRAAFARETIASAADAEAALGRCAALLESKWREWFGVDLGTEAEKPGEQRAYLAGKAGYAAQAQGIRKLGPGL